MRKQHSMHEGRWNDRWSHTLDPKPLLRGWLHALAALGAIGVTLGLMIDTYRQPQRLVAMVIFGLSMTMLYSVSALYHLGRWQGRRAVVLHALDRASIFVLIAGTYTPFCMVLLDGVARAVLLAVVWGLALLGVGSAIATLRSPRWSSTLLYLGMGWLSAIMLPTLIATLPLPALGLVVGGGILYSVGAVIYALERPNPWPKIFGFHEIFHLFVVGGSVSFLLAIWGWVVPFRLA